MNNLRLAAKQALEALEKPIFDDFMQWALAMRNAREALKQALDEPEQSSLDVTGSSLIPVKWDASAPVVLNNGRLTQYPDGSIGLGTPAKPEQKPVAWWNGRETVWFEHELMGHKPPIDNPIPLYTAHNRP